MKAKRYQGQRGTERDQPRDVVLKLRLTEKEADILNEVAERSNRPLTKIALSAINATFTISAIMWLLRETAKNRPDIKQLFDAFDLMEKNLMTEIKKRLDANPSGPMSDEDLLLANTLDQIATTQLTLTRFNFGASEWMELEGRKPIQERLDF